LALWRKVDFLELLRQHLNSPLEWQIIYWKQRETIKWVTYGDAGTKFFHANATIRHRQNYITTLEDSDGTMITRHEDKAKLLWEAYKHRLEQRLGTSKFSHMYFDLHTLLSPYGNLECLEEPFFREKIKSIIQELPANKSPGSYVFNGEFLKKCWPTVGKDFHDLCQELYEEKICMQSINGSHIVLVQKKIQPKLWTTNLSHF
jgi:hypothetical protein